MIGLGQTSWFITALARHWRQITYESVHSIIQNLEPEKYMELKRLYYEAFASGGGKEESPEAEEKLKQELTILGVL